LLAQITTLDPGGRSTAAERLLGFPDETIPPLLADAYLRGHVAIPPSPRLAAPLARLDLSEIQILAPDAAACPPLLRRLAELGRAELRRLAPLVIDLWAQGHRETTSLAASVLHKLSPDEILPLVADHLRRGEWGYLGLITRPVQRSPEALGLLARA